MTLLNDAEDVRIGSMEVQSVYLGETLVWQRKQKNLSVEPERIWLEDENDMEVVNVTSDTDWTVK